MKARQKADLYMDAITASHITHKKIRRERATSKVAHSMNTQWELIKSGIKALDDRRDFALVNVKLFLMAS